MAKLRDTPINSSDLRQYLETQDDFALELFAFRQAQALGFSASHGGTYEDPATKKTRQYDVRASMARLAKHIKLTIECKSLKNSAPLLISRIPRASAEAFHQFIYSYTPRGVLAVMDNLIPAKAMTVEDSNFYLEGDHVGKSIAQVGRSLKEGELVGGDADVYDKWYQAFASAHDLVQDAIHARRSNPEGTQATVVIPVLTVPDATLWVADHSAEGALERDPYQVDEATLYVGREYWEPASIEVVLSHLHICTKSGLYNLLARISNSDTFWEQAFPQDLIRKAFLSR